ncbi:hypothetical protein DL95DRAFT_383475, partial [Leptodontidium sp. 2 PMI_412]
MLKAQEASRRKSQPASQNAPIDFQEELMHLRLHRQAEAHQRRKRAAEQEQKILLQR